MKYFLGFVWFMLSFLLSVAAFVGVTYVVCWSFNIDFHVQYGLGVYVIYHVIKGLTDKNG